MNSAQNNSSVQVLKNTEPEDFRVVHDSLMAVNA
jgi:hypothetical protein